MTAACVKRLQKELVRLKSESFDNMDAHPSESDMLTWIVVFDGPRYTPYSTGEYLAKIIFPKDYPFKGPDFILLTPNGRFEPNTKICTTNSSFHPEDWSPAWTVEKMVQGLMSFMGEDQNGLGALFLSEAQRRQFAQTSRQFNLTQPYYKSLFPARYAKSKGLSPEETAAFLDSVGFAKSVKAAEATTTSHHEQVRRQREEGVAVAAASKTPQNSASKKEKRVAVQVIELD
jgi:ubiquitin-protein ligase